MTKHAPAIQRHQTALSGISKLIVAARMVPSYEVYIGFFLTLNFLVNSAERLGAELKI